MREAGDRAERRLVPWVWCIACRGLWRGVAAVRLQSLKLHNFRCFEDVQMEFHPYCNVLVGINGAGKSSVLDAVAIALSGFLSAMDGAAGISLHKDDVRYAMYKNGSIINREQQFPADVEALGIVSQVGELSWRRSLNTLQGRTTVKDAKAIVEYGRTLQSGIREGKAGIVLPLIAYYGTGRLWARKQNRMGGYGEQRNQPGSRLQGYQDCLSAVSNEKMMLAWFAHMTYLRLQEEQEIPELALVEQAMAECYRGIETAAKSVSVRYSVKLSELEIKVVRQDESVEYLPLHLLSDGIKTILNMVADIAYRMAVLNPQLGQDILKKTPGVVLIDEIDMHLHPAWQKRILKDLREVFQELQFIVTTHAPSVLVNTNREEVRIVSDGCIYMPDVMTYGRNVDAVMLELMGIAVRPADIANKIASFHKALDEGRLEYAKELLSALEKQLGVNDQDVIDARIAFDLETM